MLLQCYRESTEQFSCSRWTRELSMREIARRLERSRSTINRELDRNTAERDVGGYDANLADSRAGSDWSVRVACG